MTGLSFEVSSEILNISILIFISLFVFGGLTGIVLGVVTLDYFFHDSYYVVGHFHYVIALRVRFGVLRGYFSYLEVVSQITRDRELNLTPLILSYYIRNATIMPLHLLGFESLSRRYSTFSVALSNYNSISSFFSMMNSISFYMILIEQIKCVTNWKLVF